MLSVSLIVSSVCVRREFDSKFGSCFVLFLLVSRIGFKWIVVECPVCDPFVTGSVFTLFSVKD